jgi:hypothetical protein
MPPGRRHLVPDEEELARWHAENGADVSPDEYLAKYRDLLSRGVSKVWKVYLDTNAWIRLREVLKGHGTPDEIALHQRLASLVAACKAICVSHLHSLLELALQEESSLRLTAQLLDELTGGVALAPPDALRAWECAQFVQAQIGVPVPAELCPWTMAGIMHRNELARDLLPAAAPDRAMNSTLKASLDIFWRMSFSEVFEAFDWNTREILGFTLDDIPAVEKLRHNNRAQRTSYEQLRRREFKNFLDAHLRPLFAHTLTRSGITEQTVVDNVAAAAREQFKRRTLGTRLGSSNLFAELYSLYATGERPLTTNDYVDWAHAGVALPHCDVFVTERHLTHQLTHVLRADVQFDCKVVAGAKAALAALDDLDRRQRP